MEAQLFAHKKADASLLSWVLLIGITISFAALVSNWAIKNAERFDPQDITAVELYCDDVAININSVCTIKNTGSYDITRLIIVRDVAGTIEENLDPPIIPNADRSLAGIYDCTTSMGNHEIIPVTNSTEGKFVPCSIRRISVP